MSDIPYITASIIAGAAVATAIAWFTPISSNGAPKKEVKIVPNEKVQVALEKSPHLKKFFGISEDGTNEKTPNSIEETFQSSNEQNTDADDPLITLRSCLGLVVFAFALYAANIVTKGAFGRFIAGMFPVETEALKIKSWLERWA